MFLGGRGAGFQDPFGDLIKKIMNIIHEHAQLQPTCELGSQKYELWVIHTERKGECPSALPSARQNLKNSSFFCFQLRRKRIRRCECVLNTCKSSTTA